jgi:hypothetical protein
VIVFFFRKIIKILGTFFCPPIRGQMDDAKSSKKFRCKKCDYITCRKSQYERHILTDKHKMDDKEDKKKFQKNVHFLCECGKEYKYRQGLWKHQQTCNIFENSTIIQEQSEIKILTNLVLDVVKQNNELTNKIVDVCKNIQPLNMYNNINSNNKTFNINFFLNETCKDAMNIMDFVDSVKIQLSDLENVGKLGFVEGISNIIIKNLKELDVHKRPVHCSDSKREVMYVKDEDKWEKENNDKKKLRKAIKHIAHKNSNMLPAFKAKYPDCGKSESKYVDQYNKLVVEAMGGKGDNETEKEDKIIRKIAKEIIIEKEI